MDSSGDIKTDDTRAEEIGIIVHEGREFASGGFSIDLEHGRMVAYVVEHKPPMDGPREPSGFVRYTLTTWGGQTLAQLERTDRHSALCRYSCFCFAGPRGFRNMTGRSTALYSFRTREPIAGYHWYGRGLGAGCALKLRRGRKA